MTEPPRPPGSGNPDDPTTPFNPPNDPHYGSAPPPPGYEAPPPPPYGYSPQPGYAPSQNDKNWILVAHFGGALGSLLSLGVGGWIAPLVALLGKGNQAPAVRAEAVKALNFQLIWSVVAVVGWVVWCLALVVVPVAMLVSILFGVIAGVRANNNQPYNYPLTYQFIK